jgi:hypothetical protein
MELYIAKKTKEDDFRQFSKIYEKENNMLSGR